jgi:hypothetical protein
MSWRIAFVADNSGQWLINGLRFTKEEAEANVADLAMRWTMVTDTAVEESDDPVNYRWVDGKAVSLNPNCESFGVELESDPPQDDEFTCWCHQCNVKRTAQPPIQQSLAL